MLKRHTTKTKSPCSDVLRLKVHSPRIFWCGLCRTIGGLMRMAVVAGIVFGIFWAANYGLQRTILRNNEFQIGLIDLNPNRVMDEQRLMEIGGIDPNGSIFEVDLDMLEEKIVALPEVAAAHVERELPDTLHVRIAERAPVAWLEIPARSIPGRDVKRGLLIDAKNVVFPCPPGMVDEAASLPVFVVSSPDSPVPVPGEKFQIHELTHAVELLSLCRSAPGGDEFPIDRVEQENAWSMLVHTRSGAVARFGLLNQDRQLADLMAALRYARERKYQLATIDLIPERNIPVTFSTPPPPPPPLPKAIPVGESSPSGEKPPAAIRIQPAPRAIIIDCD
jgi:hypothetical protein